MDSSAPLRSIAYCGDDGIVVVANTDLVPDQRMRKPHVPVGGMVSDGGVLRMLKPSQLAGTPITYQVSAAWWAAPGAALWLM